MEKNMERTWKVLLMIESHKKIRLILRKPYKGLRVYRGMKGYTGVCRHLFFLAVCQEKSN